ncbi:MAG: hypothetical protein ACRC3B_14395, partial [Bacteroidia bacterium]
MNELSEATSTNLQQVEITPQYYSGDLTLLAENLYQLITKKNFWGNADTAALEKAIPADLSYEQRSELENIYWEKYQRNLFNDIYYETTHYLFQLNEEKSGVIAFDKLSFPQSYRKFENVSISLSVQENKASTGSTITCTYGGPKFQPSESTGSLQDRANAKYLLEKKFRPKLVRWLIRKPDDDYEYEQVRKIDKTTFDFEADKAGTYSIMALVLWYNNAYIVIKDYISVVDSQELANNSLAKQKDLSDQTFAQQKIGLTAQLSAVKAEQHFVPEADSNAVSLIKLSNGTNPFIVYPSRDYSVQRQHYQIIPATDAAKFSWFVIPDDQFMLSGNSNLYFPDSERTNIHIHPVSQEIQAYSPFASLDPASNTSAFIPFPAIRGGVLDKNRFTVVCRQFDKNGKIIVESRYIQYLNLFDTEENN